MRGSRRIIALTALLGIAALAAAAVEIASDAGPGRATRTALDKAAFIGRADAICAQRIPEIGVYYRTALADESAGRTAAARVASRRFQAAARRMIDGIEALGAPADGAGAVTTLVSEYRRLFADAIADTQASNADADVLRAKIASAAAAFGFRVCGRM
jgi:hypothetical protein